MTQTTAAATTNTTNLVPTIILDALIGLLILHRRWRRATTLERTATSTSTPLVIGETGRP
jgi:hypothetical protein